MGYDSLTSDTEALTKVKLGQVDRLKKTTTGINENHWQS